MPTSVDFIDSIHAPNDTTNGAAIVSKIIVGCNGKIFIGNPGHWETPDVTVYDDTTGKIDSVAIGQNWYIVDGANHTSGTIITVNAISGAVSRLATGGTAQHASQATMLAPYRNRLITSGYELNPFTIYGSAVGNHGVVDPTDESPTGGWELNASDAGTVDHAVTALIPFTDDFMVIGCDDAVYLLRGDPAAGGRLDNLLIGEGMVSPHGWARDDRGDIYYISRTGLMHIPAGGGIPRSVSTGKVSHFFSSIDWSVRVARLAWDAKWRQLWIFLPWTTSHEVTHMMWDQTTNSFWPQQFPNDFGPTWVKSMVGETFQQRQALMGGFDGLVRIMSPHFLADDVTPITSRIRFAPRLLAPQGEFGQINELGVVMGSGRLLPGARIRIYSGDTPQDVAEATTADIELDTTDTGRVIFRDRLRTNSLGLQIEGLDTYEGWAFEQGYLVARPAGRIR